MKYNIILELTAEKEIAKSYEWGVENWGVVQANKWYQSLMKTIAKLDSFPHRHPLAPESKEFNIEIRQIVFQRYRILFLVSDDTVYVLYFRTAYHQKTDLIDDAEEESF
jgi:plasmid stabilization system protein ParE